MAATTDVNLPALVVHDGITCDICSASPLRGPRFKCLHCADYDLCGPCHHANATRILRKINAATGGPPIPGDAEPLHDSQHAFVCLIAPLYLLNLKPLDLTTTAAKLSLPMLPQPQLQSAIGTYTNLPAVGKPNFPSQPAQATGKPGFPPTLPTSSITTPQAFNFNFKTQPAVTFPTKPGLGSQAPTQIIRAPQSLSKFAVRNSLGLALMGVMIKEQERNQPGTTSFVSAFSPAAQDVNVLISPLNLWLVLTLVASGSRPGSRVQELLHRQLGIDLPIASNIFAKPPTTEGPPATTAAKPLLDSLKEMKRALEATSGTIQLHSLVVLRNAHRDAFAPSNPHAFPRIARSFYDAQLTAFARGRDTELVAAANNWSNESTRGLIPRMIECLDALDNDVKLLLFNSVCLKARWEKPFPANLTKMASFYPRGYNAFPSPRPCRLMCNVDLYSFAENPYAEAVRIPLVTMFMYGADTALAAYILLPKPNVPLSALLTSADPGNPSALPPAQSLPYHLAFQCTPQRLQLNVPSFTATTPATAVSLTRHICTAFPDTLAPAFRPDHIAAPFSPMLPDADPTGKRLCLGDLVQKCYARVDEQGIEAAAATMASMVPLSAAGPLDATAGRVFKADRPFLFCAGMERKGAGAGAEGMAVELVMVVAVKDV
ncbi:hypothetical protein HDU96_001476 [Phlyctochytrium bullatum]|nr:hypothetical protein HDU96_001476 [Phlyctochytrium bullatum]